MRDPAIITYEAEKELKKLENQANANSTAVGKLLSKEAGDIGKIIYENPALEEKVKKELEKIRIANKEINERESKQKKESNTLIYPKDLGQVEYKQNFMMFTFYEHKPDQKRRDQLKEEHIVYPKIMLPFSARMMYSSIAAQYGQIEQNQFLNVLYENAREFGMTSRGLSQAINHAVDEGSFADAAESFFLRSLLNTEIKGVKAGYHAYGVALNNNFTVRYQDREPMYRNFQPAWTFVPKTEDDAKTLNDVVRIFQRNALPREMNMDLDSKVRYSNHFRYPRKLKVELFVGRDVYNRPKKFEIKYLPMVINTVEVSNNDKSGSLGPETVPLHKIDEKFYHTETTIRLSLEETEIFTRKSVAENFKKLGQGRAMAKLIREAKLSNIIPKDLLQ